MEALFAITLGLLTASGVYLLLRARTFPVVLGLTLISYAVNLFLFAMGRLGGSVAVIGTPGEYGDPLPQALVLTAIVIGFAMTAFVVVLALRGLGDLGSDHVDGRPDEGGAAPMSHWLILPILLPCLPAACCCCRWPSVAARLVVARGAGADPIESVADARPPAAT